MTIAVATLAALAPPAAARAAAPEPYFDVRASARRPPPLAATSALERRLGARAVVEVDRVTRTPRVLARLDGTLTGPAAGAPEDVALRYVHANLAALGLTAADLDTLRPPAETAAGGVTQVRWRQAVDGVPAADSELRVEVTRDGRVLSVLGAPAHGLGPVTTPRLDAGEAVRAVQDDVGVFRALARDDGPAGATRATEYTDGTTAALALYARRLAWRVTYRAASDAVYDVIVDARTGRVLRRANLVDSDSPAQVWENYPGAPLGGAASTQDLEQNGWLAAGSGTLDGAYVRAYSDLDDDDVAQAGEEITPSAGSFAFPFSSFSASDPSCGPQHPCSWSGAATGTSWQTNRLQDGVQAFYLANRFHDHLAAAPIGFGFANGSGGVDKLVLNTDDGASLSSGHRSNANMYTPPGGQSPLMQMYLWQPPSFRAMNGGDDASILYHEYTHGLTSRLVVDASGTDALTSRQAGAMAEGFSDWYAKDFLVSQFPGLDTAAPGDVHMGVYTDLLPNAIRRQGLDCPVGAAPSTYCNGGFTYGDFGRIGGGPEVHDDGEIWAETLWDLRTALRRELGDADGAAAAEGLVTQALRLSPPEPSFLDMRNAILQADTAAGGAHRNLIWSVFGARGMGYYASTTGAEDLAPIEDFSTPPAAGEPRGAIAGQVTDADTGRPLAGATVTVGGVESGPDALTAVTDAGGRYAIAGVPGRSYPNIVFRAKGYDQRIQPAQVQAGATATLDATLRRDWAAVPGGAALASAEGTELQDLGCGPGAALDQQLDTAWSTIYAPGKPPKAVVVALPRSIDVSAVAVDPGEGCGHSPAAATRAYTLQTSSTSAAGPWKTASAGTFTAADRHRLNLVTPIAPATAVRYVKLTALTAQGGDYIDVSELEVYGTQHVPETTIESGPPPVGFDATPTFVLGSDDPAATFECSLDGAVFAPCASPLTIEPPLAAGDHTLDVRAIGSDGEPDPTPEHRAFTIDAAPPQAMIAPAAVVPALRPPASPRPAFARVSAVRSASLRTLLARGRLTLTVRAAERGARFVVRARLGGLRTVIGRLTRTAARSGRVALVLRLDRRRLRSARAGSSLIVQVEATGRSLGRVVRTLTVRLRR